MRGAPLRRRWRPGPRDSGNALGSAVLRCWSRCGAHRCRAAGDRAGCRIRPGGRDRRHIAGGARLRCPAMLARGRLGRAWLPGRTSVRTGSGGPILGPRVVAGPRCGRRLISNLCRKAGLVWRWPCRFAARDACALPRGFWHLPRRCGRCVVLYPLSGSVAPRPSRRPRHVARPTIASRHLARSRGRGCRGVFPGMLDRGRGAGPAAVPRAASGWHRSAGSVAPPSPCAVLMGKAGAQGFEGARRHAGDPAPCGSGPWP